MRKVAQVAERSTRCFRGPDGYDPFGNRIQIGVIAKRPMHFGEVSRFATRATS
jgi:hypothetical protein